jgi:hypothetical protein
MARNPRAARIRASYLSERIHHFFARTSKDDEAQGITVFKSIAENGLLLTVANQTGGADVFTFGTSTGPVVVEIEQLARVCFTDIPEGKLEVHSEDAKYGRFAIGFRRATIVSWAGSPVWYLPNTGAAALTDAAGVMIQYLKFGRDALKLLEALYQHPSCRPSLSFADGAVLQPTDVINRSHLADGSIARALSFVKEMSPRNAPSEEFQYLYEREWRIVDGLKINGADVCKPLPAPLRDALLRTRPEWAQPIKCGTEGYRSQYFTQPMIDHFRLFDGSGAPDDTVAKKIANVLVPSGSAKREIEKYILANSERFSNPPPSVEIFGLRRGDFRQCASAALQWFTGQARGLS